MYSYLKLSGFVKVFLLCLFLFIQVPTINGLNNENPKTAKPISKPIIVPQPVPGWPNQTQGAVQSSPVIADVSNDGILEVVVGSDDGYLYCYSGMDGKEVWSFYAGGEIKSSPAAADVDNDGSKEVIICASSGYIYCLSGDSGNPIWQYQTEGSINSPPAIANVDGHPGLEIVASSTIDYYHCKAYCFNAATGDILWEHDTDQYTLSPIIGVVSRLNQTRVIVGSWHKIYCLNGENGSQIWEYSFDGGYYGGYYYFLNHSPAIGDLNNDGELEIIIYTYHATMPYSGGAVWHYVDCVSLTDGARLWRFSMFNGRNPPNHLNEHESFPVIADLNNDGNFEVIITNNYTPYYTHTCNIFCIDGRNGNLIWENGLNEVVGSPMAVSDINNDGILEVLVGSADTYPPYLDGYLYSINGRDGKILWKYQTKISICSSPAIGDINNDGKQEIVFGCDNGKVYALAMDGRCRYNAVFWQKICHDDWNTGFYGPLFIDKKSKPR